MKIRAQARIILIVLFVVIAAAYLSRRSLLLDNRLYLIPPFVAVVCGLYAAGTYHLSNPHGKSVALSTAGLTCFFVGEVLFYSYQFIFHTSPFPSVADVFYLAAYPLLMAGFVREAWLNKTSWRNFRKSVLVLAILLLVTLIAVVSYFGVYLAYDKQASFVNNAVSIAYGIGDLFLIIPSLFMLKMALDYRGGKLFNSWLLTLSALVCLLLGDILFAVFRDKYNNLVWPYPLIDLAWVASYLLFAYSFVYTASTIKEIHRKLQP